MKIKNCGFDIPENKKIRVIIDTDAACEADDPYAIVHGLLSPKLIVKAILAEHFNRSGSVQRSYNEIQTIIKAMEIDVPIFMGEEGPLSLESDTISEASQFIIDEALREEDKPLYVLCQGAITNVASAIKRCPDIIGKMTIIWIGTHGDKIQPPPFREFNAGNDIEAANFVLGSGVDLWIVPSSVYVTVTVGIAELKKKVYPCGKIGQHLVENLISYNMSDEAGWTQGESWSLGDSPAIALAINPEAGHYHMAPAPIIGDETQTLKMSDEQLKTRPAARIYDDIDSRYVLEDFFAKLSLIYGG